MKHKLEAQNPQTSAEQKHSVRQRFMQWLNRYDFRDEDGFMGLLHRLIFGIVLIVGVLMLLQQISEFDKRGGWSTFFPMAIIVALIIGTEFWKFSCLQRQKSILWLCSVQGLAASGLSFVYSGASAIAVYVLILTELYITLDGKYSPFYVFVLAVLLYDAASILQNLLLFAPVSWMSLVTQLMGAAFAFTVHFVAAQIALAFYKQFVRLNMALRELDASKKELEKAYEAVAEVTALEERQRIAKDIHDTAGHSITTVIMQTESAKLLIAENPEEAKGKIIAANLQAKHALEELRNSVHVLSGKKENQTLKDALEAIVHESTDGTGITIRSKIEDVDVSEAKFRFLCNTLKEGISNGLRHGSATAFWFECKQEQNTIRFLLSDNGCGIANVKLKKGFGLTSMQDRAKALGGQVRIVTEEGEGFDLELTLPIDAKI